MKEETEANERIAREATNKVLNWIAHTPTDQLADDKIDGIAPDIQRIIREALCAAQVKPNALVGYPHQMEWHVEGPIIHIPKVGEFALTSELQAMALWLRHEKELADVAAQVKQPQPKEDAFKDFVHRRLDTAGVPKEFPNGKHTKEGCRIGDRLDWVLERVQVQPKEVSASPGNDVAVGPGVNEETGDTLIREVRRRTKLFVEDNYQNLTGEEYNAVSLIIESAMLIGGSIILGHNPKPSGDSRPLAGGLQNEEESTAPKLASDQELERVAREFVDKLQPSTDGERVTQFNIVLSALKQVQPKQKEKDKV